MDRNGNPTKGQNRGRKQAASAEDIEWLKGYVRNHPGETASTFQQAMVRERGVSVTSRTVQRYLRQASFVVKRISAQPIHRVSRAVISARYNFAAEFLSNIAPDDRARFYLDEFGVDDKCVARCGWGERGTLRTHVYFLEVLKRAKLVVKLISIVLYSLLRQANLWCCCFRARRRAVTEGASVSAQPSAATG